MPFGEQKKTALCFRLTEIQNSNQSLIKTKFPDVSGPRWSRGDCGLGGGGSRLCRPVVSQVHAVPGNNVLWRFERSEECTPTALIGAQGRTCAPNFDLITTQICPRAKLHRMLAGRFPHSATLSRGKASHPKVLWKTENWSSHCEKGANMPSRPRLWS